MYSTCIYCHAPLGANDAIEHFPVGRRVAFDPAKGRLWAVCPSCERWNLAPLDERWEAIEECERRFRGTHLRYSTDNVGLAQLPAGVDLVRIGRALRPEVAAWRYGRVLLREGGSLGARVLGGLAGAAARAVNRVRVPRQHGPMTVRLLVGRRSSQVLDVVRLTRAAAGPDVPLAVVRYRHIADAALARPERGQPWALVVPHDRGLVTLEGDDGVRTASKLLAAMNRAEVAGSPGRELVDLAARKLDESAQADSYFNRVLALALELDWGRVQNVEVPMPVAFGATEGGASDVERLAFRLTGRTFWGHGGIGSLPRATLLDVPLVDRLALEMAAHEDAERQALEGELSALQAAWRDAEEIAAIADGLLTEVDLPDALPAPREGRD